MENSAIIGGDERFGALASDVEKLLKLDRTGQALPQGLALHILHDKKKFVFGFEEVVDRGYARLIPHLRRALRLFHESAAIERIIAQSGRKALERDGTFQPGIPGAVHLAHAAGTDPVLDFKSARNCASKKILGGAGVNRHMG